MPNMSNTSLSSQSDVGQIGAALGRAAPSAICVFTRTRVFRTNE
jgi:hypothetical protein